MLLLSLVQCPLSRNEWLCVKLQSANALPKSFEYAEKLVESRGSVLVKVAR